MYVQCTIWLQVALYKIVYIIYKGLYATTVQWLQVALYNIVYIICKGLYVCAQLYKMVAGGVV